MTRLFFALMFVVFFGLLTSCSNDEPLDSSGLKDNKLAQLTVSLALPRNSGTDKVTTRVGETDLKDLYILGFSIDEVTNEEYFDFIDHITSGIKTGNNNNEKTFTAYVNVKKEKQQFVIIANVGDRLTHLAPNGQLKKDVLEGLVYDNPENTWNMFPMWGESDPIKINNGVNTMNKLKLYRMVSRIDVALATEEVKHIFKLFEVYLYNRKTKGYIVPSSENWNANPKKPTVPTSTGSEDPVTAEQPLFFDNMTTLYTALESTIYTFESATGSDERDEATCLVIGGLLSGEIDFSYYRMDFVDNLGESKDLIRNHKYTLQILNVLGKGKPTPEEALTSTYVELETNVLSWNESQVDVIFDGQYYFKISKDQFEFDDEISRIDFKMETNHPEPIRVLGTPDWVGVSGTKTGEYTWDFFMETKSYPTTSPLENSVSFNVGNLNYTVPVKWNGSTSDISFSMADSYIMNGGLYAISVFSDFGWKVKLKDPNQAAFISLQYSEGNGSESGELLLFKTYNDFQLMQEQPRDMRVPHEPVEVGLIFESKTHTGQTWEVNIQLTSGLVGVPSNSYILTPMASQTDGVHYPGFFIPVSITNDPVVLSALGISSGLNMGSTQDFEAKLIWTDNPNGMADNSNVRSLKAIGTGGDGYLYVEPGTGEGNALVAITVNGVIKWSWHLWITNDKAIIESGASAGNRWMVQNLGALNRTGWSGTPTLGDKVTGLYYQWGRKDPFPGGSVYDKNGNIITWDIQTSYRSWDWSISNPFTIMNEWTPPLGVDAWNSNGGASKAIFDPCPEGWRMTLNADWINATGIPSSNGYFINDKGGFYPLAGGYDSVFKEIRNIGENGYCWNAEAIDNSWAYCLGITKSAIYETTVVDVSGALNVRCVRE